MVGSQSDVRRKLGEKYMDLDSRPEWSDMEPIRKLLNEILKDTKKFQVTLSEKY